MKILVTGCAGFIGFHATTKLLDRDDEVVGVDNLSDYYDVSLKEARLAQLTPRAGFRFERIPLEDRERVAALFERERFDRVIHLAAQAGVRYSLAHPFAYVDSNLKGFLTVLEGCRHSGVDHLVYASSSSVYGSNKTVPFSVHDSVDHPVSLYAATKKANELMAHTYSHLYQLPATALRFFTVYGPWGRPDMAYFLFTKAILEGTPIKVFNYGDMMRDFTYVDDIVEGVLRALDRIPKPDPAWDGHFPDPATSAAPWRVYNIGNNRPEKLTRFIEVIEECLGRKAIIELLPLQPGDVQSTAAEVEDLVRDVGFHPRTPIETGIKKFVEWYRGYYGM